MMLWGYGTGSAFSVTASLVAMLVVVVLLVVAIWAITRMTARGSAERGDPAFDILRQRFARGEISQAEFDDAKRILGIR